MNRRDLVLLSALAALFITTSAAFAQAAEKVYRVGVLAPVGIRPIETFKERLRELGWKEGQNNLAHPGGNVTGFASQSFEPEEKRFELLRELVPGMTRIVMLGNIGNLYADLAIKRLEPLVEAAGLKFEGVKIDAQSGLEGGLDAVRRARPDGVLVAVPAFYTPRVYRPMVAFMAANRLPAIYSNREIVEAGGLIAYSTNFDDLLRQAAGYVDKILKGASPGELPVQQAATFELLVNLTTAKALGLTIPPMIIARADEIIE